MFRSIESITIFTENSTELAKFYKERVDLTLTTEAELGEFGENVFGFEFEGGTSLFIVDHSKVKGKNKEPERILFNLEVDNIETEVKRLEEAGVKKVADIYHVEGYGQISTFEDLDGNYFQLVQIRPTS